MEPIEEMSKEDEEFLKKNQIENEKTDENK